MLMHILKLAQAWDCFDNEEVIQFVKEIHSYHRQDGPFLATRNLPQRPREFWSLIVNAPYLHKFAMKIFAIVPHSAAVERLFSSLNITKTKVRNNMSIPTLKMLATIRANLRKTVPQRTLQTRLERFTTVNNLNEVCTVLLLLQNLFFSSE